MSHYPPGGQPPYYGYHAPVPPASVLPTPTYAYVPTPVMMPMPGPVYQPPPPLPAYPQPPLPPTTYVTNHIYQQPPPEPVRVVENYDFAAHAIGTLGRKFMKNVSAKVVRALDHNSVCRVHSYNAGCNCCTSKQEDAAPSPTPVPSTNDLIDWIPCTSRDAMQFSHRAVVAGKEGWDGSPLWVIRAHHSGDLVPGKLAVRHRAAYIPNAGKEVPVHNFDLLCAPAHTVRWLPSSNGQVPVGAIPAGNTHSAEPLYIGRTKHRRSITPGKVHPSHGCLYISYDGREISHKSYEVLCKIVG